VVTACNRSCIGTNFIAISLFPLVSLSLFNSYPGLDFLCSWTLWRSWIMTLEGGGWNSGWKWRGWQAATWEKMHRVLKIWNRLYQEVKIGLIYMYMCAICTHSHRNTHTHTEIHTHTQWVKQSIPWRKQKNRTSEESTKTQFVHSFTHSFILSIFM